MTARQIHRGQSTVEALKSKKSKASLICIDSTVNDGMVHTTGAYLRHGPSVHPQTRRSIFLTLSTERPYDLGPRENWRRLMRLPLFGHRRRELKYVSPSIR